MKSILYKQKEVHRRTIVFYAILFMVSFSYAQVGIGNTNPQATLDITASNQATPSNEDGILIPRVDAFPLTNPTGLQNGMLIYLTMTVGTDPKGIYQWDNATTSWIRLTSVEKLNDLSDGKSDADGSQDGSSVFIGINAGENDNSSNNKSVGVGFGTLQANTNGIENVAFGYEALANTVTRDDNTAIGYHALHSNEIRIRNTAVGYEALNSHISGSNNSAFGYGALSTDAGSSNTAFGDNSLGNLAYDATITPSAVNNTAFGAYSGEQLTTGGSNVFIGYNAGLVLNGYSNVLIGAEVNSLNTVGGDNVFIGYSAGVNAAFDDATSTLLIQNSDSPTPLIHGDFASNIVGIGKEAITYTLEVNGTIEATQFKLSALNTAPAGNVPTGAGEVGEIRVSEVASETYIYVCIATDTWVRTAAFETTW